MSLFSDTVVTGGSRFHVQNGGPSVGKNASGSNSRRSRGLVAPLVHLAKNPLGLLVKEGPHEAIHTDSSESDRRQLLYLRLKEAENYDDWSAAATELDTMEGNDAWKLEDDSSEYDHALLKARLAEIDDARISCDVKRMIYLIRTALARDLGGMGDLRLYKHSHVGTKKLIERYNDSVMQLLATLPDVAARQGTQCSLRLSVVLDELLRARQAYGRTALLLSGGGTFGMNHIGVVKCLWEQRLLPRIISGASAGSIVCAVLCTKSDTEIPVVLDEFCYGDLAVFEKVGEADSLVAKATRFLTEGALFDITHLTRVMRNMLGDMTFQESYNRTHRVLNITVSSASMYELPRLLNYVTAPDVMIWSAVCASCSVPFIFSAASLKAKDRATGKEVPWDPTPNDGWIDGSVDNDLPMNRLAEMFNVNHFIVSQVNPHVVPFLVKDEEAVKAEANESSSGPSWVQNMANFAKGEALHRLDMLAEMGVFPNVVTKARSVLSQRYSGDITIFPSISYTNFPKILSNPTTEYMLHCLLMGERATWPKLSRIRNHVAIELSLYDCINKMRPHVHFNQSESIRRLETLNSHSGDLNRARRLHKSTHFDSQAEDPTLMVGLSAPFRRSSNSHTQFPSRQTPKLHLPSHHKRGDIKSSDMSKSLAFVDTVSSTDPDGSSTGGDFSSNDESNTSDFLSSPSPPRSPPSSIPDLWPSTRQIIFPSVSNPSTPLSFTAAGRRNSASLNLTMTSSTAPSSPELRYKRLFHGPLHSPIPGSPNILPKENRRDQQFPHIDTQLASLRKAESFQGIASADSSDGDDACVFEHPYPGQTSHRDTDKAVKQGTKSGTQEKSSFELPLDYSGTRGMLLRKKRSRSNGFAS